jgi:DNA-binding response OmpR family regulator
MGYYFCLTQLGSPVFARVLFYAYMKILLVEDETSLASFIQKGIKRRAMNSKSRMMVRWGQQPFDVIVLDVNLPGMNGFELCRYIKQHSPRQAVLLLTALDGLQDKESGFGAGADDYLVKPFEFRELLLRIRALARCSTAYAGQHTVLRAADLEMDTDTRLVRRVGQLI